MLPEWDVYNDAPSMIFFPEELAPATLAIFRLGRRLQDRQLSRDILLI